MSRATFRYRPLAFLHLHASDAKKPKARPRPPSRPPPPPWLPLSVATRPASQRTTLALRFESSPTLVLVGQRSRSANNGVLLPGHISPPILAAPCSCFASADRIRLRQCCLIIADSTSPSLLGFPPYPDSSTLRWIGGARVPALYSLETHRISRATRTANVMGV